MFGFGALGQFAIGQVGPVNNAPLVNGVRLPLYTQGSYTYPQTQSNYWNGTLITFPGQGA